MKQELQSENRESVTKQDIRSMSLAELSERFAAMGEKPFRAKQVYSWLHEKRVKSFEEMTNLSRALRERLSEDYVLTVLEPVEILESKIDSTKKFLFRLADGNVIESVWMEYHHGNSVCISSQVGCRMGCRFCASTIGGVVRSLKPSEMLDQIYRIQKDSGERVSNVVVMGTGEPLDNYDNLLRFIRLLTDENGLNISQRNLTVSTCGIVPRIRQLADENLAITLALSLHAVTQEKRAELMPIANKYPLAEVLDACAYYHQKTGRRMTFEYSLVGGVNDHPEDARRLAALAKPIHSHINLIPVNPVTERSFVQPKKEVIGNFKKELEKYGINVTIRREMGRDIDGACGQLRRRYLKSGEPGEEESDAESLGHEGYRKMP